MKDKTPPYDLLKEVSRVCPKAMHTYLDLWERTDVDGSVTFLKEEIKTLLCVSLAKFNSDIRYLVAQGVLSVDESPLMITFRLVTWHQLSDLHELI